MMTQPVERTSRGAAPSYLSTHLQAAKIPATEFDPTDVEHRRCYARFKLTGKWDMKFATKYPRSIESTVQELLAQHACKFEWQT